MSLPPLGSPRPCPCEGWRGAGLGLAPRGLLCPPFAPHSPCQFAEGHGPSLPELCTVVSSWAKPGCRFSGKMAALLRALRGCLSTPLGFPAGRPEGRVVRQDRDLRGLLWTSCLGHQLQDGPSCQAGSKTRLCFLEAPMSKQGCAPRQPSNQSDLGSSPGVGMGAGSTGGRQRRHFPGAE